MILLHKVEAHHPKNTITLTLSLSLSISISHTQRHTHTHMPTMLRRSIILSCFTVLVLVQFPQTSNGKQSGDCKPSSCGNIHNISYPFRLKGDPENCGDPCCELACEDDLNLTVLYVNSHKYFVQSINYPNFTIRLVDATIQEDNCSSLPHYSTPTMLDIYSYGIYRGRSSTSLSDREISKPIYSIKCPNRVNSPLYVDAAACINGTSSNSTTTFSYLKFGRMNASDLLDSCSIELTVMTSWPVKDEFNLSFSDIRNALLYGFELSWFSVMCKKSCRGKYNSCDFDDSSNKVKCYDYVEGPFVYWLWLIFYCLVYAVGLVIGLNIVVRILCGMPCALTFLIYTLRRRHLSMFDAIESYLQNQNNLTPIRYTYSEIKKMTNDFKDKLGEGGYGSVYKGKLRSGGLVAVKLLGKSNANGQDFINEVATIGRIHHVNVVRLVGFCAERTKRALIYDFMPNGSLEKYLFSRERNINIPALSWERKYQIVLGVARGIEYLHRGCDIQILHFDIKPHNVLLDKNFVPKVSDFGLAKLCPVDNNIVSLTVARGTIGYVAPELINRSIGGISYKADVYSFGMLLMEMVGLKDVPVNEDKSSQYFPSWVYDRFRKGKDIEMGDGCGDEDEKKTAKKMTLVALWCIQMDPLERPSMNVVVKMLEGEVEHLKIPPEPLQYQQQEVEAMTWSETTSDSVALLGDSSHNSTALDVIIES
ncbi:hypothetical protein LguiB_005749 [Lonicera macranthoides]